MIPLSHDCQGLIYVLKLRILMYVLTELGYVLICQIKEEEKNNVDFKMLL